MIYRRNSITQVSYGEAVGILLLDSPVPFIPGDVANATSYTFPVRFKKVEGFTVERALAKDPGIYPALAAAAKDLEANGVRMITSDCGFMALHQEKLKAALKIPVCLSSLFQLPFIRQTLGRGKKIGIITASADSLTPDFLKGIGIDPDPVPGQTDLVIRGVEDCPEFFSAAIEEKGTLDDEQVRKEMARIAEDLARNKDLGAILLECSLLPPYAAAVHQATGLPVYDYITMITYLFSAAVPRTYHGFM
jgi:hypothetical protein